MRAVHAVVDAHLDALDAVLRERPAVQRELRADDALGHRLVEPALGGGGFGGLGGGATAAAGAERRGRGRCRRRADAAVLLDRVELDARERDDRAEDADEPQRRAAVLTMAWRAQGANCTRRMDSLWVRLQPDALPSHAEALQRSLK